MTWAKNILTYTLILSIIGSSLLVPFIHLDFEIRRDYIYEVLCINRDKPITTCGGQCFLSDQLKKVAEQQENGTQSITQLPEISFFSQELLNTNLDNTFSLKKISYGPFSSLDMPVLFNKGIFRPPQFS